MHARLFVALVSTQIQIQAVILAACFVLRKSVGIRPRPQNASLTHTNTGTPIRSARRTR
ncbi:hypothetical protein B0H10DRAFT_2225431 [Mycena sp. CBHHK59/15]|nr:hypothetical protein B0H10DRAFT_2225431 [Mycena sp. CBHHK59/15]